MWCQHMWLSLNLFHSASTGPVDTSTSGASYLSDETKEKLAVGLAVRMGASDVELDDKMDWVGPGASGDGF